jgi:calcineurin-like phosphoesterase family protein
MATYAIGDVHGEVELLASLLQQVAPTLTSDDTLVFLGDFVDRGPDARSVLDQVLELRDRAPCPVLGLLGNHEEWLLRTYRDPTSHSWILGMGGLQTVRSYSPSAAELLRAELKRRGVELIKDKVALPYAAFFDEVPAAHLAFLEGLVPFVRTPDVVCVHGGARSGVSVEDQPQHDLVWGSTTFPEDYEGPDLLVYGHRCDGLVDERGRAAPRVGPHGRTYGIDTVAVGVLTCLRFPDLAVFQASRAT